MERCDKPADICGLKPCTNLKRSVTDILPFNLQKATRDGILPAVHAILIDTFLCTHHSGS